MINFDPNSHALVFGYGSLMSKSSAQDTVTVVDFEFGYVQGYTRRFDYSHMKGLAFAAVIPAEDPEAFLAGSIVAIPKEEVKRLHLREAWYRPVAVKIYDRQKEFVGIGILYVPNVDVENPSSNFGFEPDDDYLLTCLSGILDAGDEAMTANFMEAKIGLSCLKDMLEEQDAA